MVLWGIYKFNLIGFKSLCVKSCVSLPTRHVPPAPVLCWQTLAPIPTDNRFHVESSVLQFFSQTRLWRQTWTSSMWVNYLSRSRRSLVISLRLTINDYFPLVSECQQQTALCLMMMTSHGPYLLVVSGDHWPPQLVKSWPCLTSFYDFMKIIKHHWVWQSCSTANISPF